MKHEGFTPGSDLALLIRELGSIDAALRYCERIEAVNGPLASVYSDYAARLRALQGVA